MTWLVAPIGRWLAAAGAALGVIWAAWQRGRAAERRRLEAAAMREALRRREVRDAVERDVAREPDPARQLRERWSRH